MKERYVNLNAAEEIAFTSALKDVRMGAWLIFMIGFAGTLITWETASYVWWFTLSVALTSFGFGGVVFLRLTKFLSKRALKIKST